MDLWQKPRFRRAAPTRMLGAGVPDDARPGDLVIGNRGAAAFVVQPPSRFGGLSLTLEYAGNVFEGCMFERQGPRAKIYDRS